MPEATLRAFADHGDATRAFEPASRAPLETLSRGAEAGIDLAAVTAALERDGIRSFCDSYRDLLACIEAKVSSDASEMRRGPHGWDMPRPPTCQL
jgi:transaldolase